MKRLLTPAVLMCAVVPAFAQPPSGAPCLSQINMYSFDAVPGNKAVIVTDKGRTRYRINFVGRCYNLQYKLGLRFKTFGVSKLSCVSRGDQVLMRDPGNAGFCSIQSVVYQTPAMDQADAADAAAMKAKP